MNISVKFLFKIARVSCFLNSTCINRLINNVSSLVITSTNIIWSDMFIITTTGLNTFSIPRINFDSGNTLFIKSSHMLISHSFAQNSTDFDVILDSNVLSPFISSSDQYLKLNIKLEFEFTSYSSSFSFTTSYNSWMNATITATTLEHTSFSSSFLVCVVPGS